MLLDKVANLMQPEKQVYQDGLAVGYKYKMVLMG